MNVIELTNVNKDFGSRHVIRDLSLAVEQGKFVALVGPSGVGKSTLLNMIGLLDEPTGALDEKLAQQVFAQCDMLRHKYEKTVVMVTHNLELAAKCDDQIELKSK